MTSFLVGFIKQVPVHVGFFKRNFQVSIVDINKEISKVQDPQNILSGQSGPASIGIVNHLRSSINNARGIVSEYVAVSLTLQCELRSL
jgi:hypothetical protein